MSVQEARKALKENPARAHQDVVRLVSKIIIPENVPASKALAIVDKPREAEVIQPYKRGSYVAPAAPSGSGGPETDKGPSGSGGGASGSKENHSHKRKRQESESESGEKFVKKAKTNSISNSVQNGSKSTQKYESFDAKAEKILDALGSEADSRYISAAYAGSTWKRINAARNCLYKFAQHTNTHLTWPLDSHTTLKFTNWALSKKELTHTTVKAYLHDISLLHKLKEVDNSACNTFLIKTTLRGAENLAMYENENSLGKATISLALLRKIGSEIAKSKYSRKDKQVFWASCTTAFWGSFRMGEILAKNRDGIDRESLTWKDVIMRKDYASIRVKRPKVNKGTDIVSLFAVDGLKCCPIRALRKLAELKGTGDESPFTLDNGELLTQKVFTEQLKIWALPHTSEEFVKRLTGHCFRSAIPTILAARPDIVSEEDIKIWGRWSSEAFEIYAKKSVQTKRIIFEKIKKAILSSLNR
jgi:hypothetical protein